MAGAEIVLSTSEPQPPNADFAYFIDFVRGQGSAARVFISAQEFIRACEVLDKTLCAAIDSHIEPVMVLEELQTGSLKIWLRNVLRAADDEGLKKLDWKSSVGKFLVKAKYLVLRWIDDESATPKSLPDLAEQLKQLAQDTDVRHLPDYTRPSPQDLVEALGKFQAAKDALTSGDRAKFVSEEGEVEFKLTLKWGPEELAELAVGRTIPTPPVEMILVVKKPDYLGESQWEFRHGRTPIRARVEDQGWLGRFQRREEDVRPGDALRATVIIENQYGFDNELIGQKYRVINVHEVLVDKYHQTEMFKNSGGGGGDPPPPE